MTVAVLAHPRHPHDDPAPPAFIVKQHGKLIYPEGTACAEVAGRRREGRRDGEDVFVGFGIALVHKFLTAAGKLWSSEPAVKLYARKAAKRRA